MSRFRGMAAPGIEAGEEIFSVHHMELLHHFQAGMGDIQMEGPMNHMMLGCAFSAPFLMNQVLAISAAHLSTKQAERRLLYHRIATELQTRALTTFNEQSREIDSDSCLPIFLFAGLLCQHIVFEAFSSARDDFARFLELFTKALELYRGVRAITSGVWWLQVVGRLRTRMDEAHRIEFLRLHNQKGAVAPEPEVECASLLRRLEADALNDGAIDACRRAAQLLQVQFDVQREQPFVSIIRNMALTAWSVTVHREYVDLLRERRPEALVVLAHVAVLAGRASPHWVLADGAPFVVASMAAHLGPAWSDWLVWPMGALGISQRFAGSGSGYYLREPTVR